MFSQQQSALRVGTTLQGGKYTIDRVLGCGGFGITYRVAMYNGNIRQHVAVKEFFMTGLCERSGTKMTYSNPVKAEVEAGLKNFFSEAERLQHLQLRNPNIVSVNEVFKENGTAYYVMEYVKGANLRQTVEAYVQDNGCALPEEKAKEFLAPILHVLCRLHALRCVHLDIKPDNIILNPDEDDPHCFRPVLIDFGLSKHYNQKGNVTSAFNFMGCSKGYSPNEQYQSGGLEEFTPQADVYALAATLLFMITGEDPPMAAEVTPERLRALMPEGVSERTREAIVEAMRSGKRERTRSVREFAENLGVELPTEGEAHRTVLLETRSRRNPTFRPLRFSRFQSGGTRRLVRKVLKWAGVALAVLLIGLAALVVYGIVKRGGLHSPENHNAVVTDTIQTKQEEVRNEEQADDTAKVQTSEVKPQHEDAPEEKATPPAPSEGKNEKKETAPQSASTSAAKPNTPTPVTPSAAPTSSTGSLSLGYATWKGGIKNGVPHGKGTMTFRQSHVEAGCDVQAGYRIEGTYENGSLVVGVVYDDAGNKVKTLMP